MDEFTKLITELEKLSILQTKGGWAENLPDNIWENHFKGNFKEVNSGLNVNESRWYETSTSVVKIYGKLLGITFITKLYSESSSYEDCYVTIRFNQMKEIRIISYESM